MKKEIHPIYHKKAIAKCVCGAEFIMGATKEKLSIEACSNCHPFYTGKEKILDTAGRVEKFKARHAKKSETVKSKAGKKTATKDKVVKKTTAGKK